MERLFNNYKVKKDYSQRVVIVFCICSIILSGISLYLQKTQLNYTNEAITVSVESKDVADDCKNLDIFDTSECLNKQLNEFYRFNISNIGKNLSLDELKSLGGVCKHYSEWYVSTMKQLGFYANTTSIFADVKIGNYNIGHEYAVAWDKNLSGYCLLDQTEISCIHLDVGKVKEELKDETD